MIEEKLKEIGVTLPIPPNPAGSYVPVVTTALGKISKESNRLCICINYDKKFSI